MEENKVLDQNKKRKFILEILFYIVLAFVCMFVVPDYVIERTIVDGPSMENTLLDRENVLVEKFVYKMTGLDRFDIIVFYPFGREYPDDYYVKRIIGLPGETIQIMDDQIYVDGEVLEENYGKTDSISPGIAQEPITLAEDEIFVMGDNRDISSDSRDELVGPVNLDKIGGKVVLRIYPFNRFGTID